MPKEKHPETMLEFVVRKLNDPAFNKAEIYRRTGISKATLSEIASGKNADPATSTVQRLYDLFHDLAD